MSKDRQKNNELPGMDVNRASTDQQPLPVYYVPYPQEEEINLLEYWQVLVEHKRLIGIITLSTTLFALIVSLVMTPIYRAETLLAPVTEEPGSNLSALAGQFGGLAELAGINLSSKGSSAEEAIATLKSRELANTFIEKEELLPILFPNNWDNEKKVWKKKFWGLSDESQEPSLWQAYQKFDEDIRFIDLDKKTGLVALSIEWIDPKSAAAWANRLVKYVNDALREEAINESEKSIAYLQNELGKTSIVGVQQAIYRLIEAQTKNKMMANTREEYAFKILDSAVAPEERERPKRLLIVIFAVVLGLVGGVFAAFFVRFLKNLEAK